jgi:hypothetical protein
MEGVETMKNANKEKKVLAPCGIYCPECSFLVAFETGKREHVTATPEKFDKYKNLDLKEFNCAMCTPENKSVDCEIKRCVLSRALEHCGQCDKFPCAIISRFADDGLPHHKKAVEHLDYVRKHGLEKLIEDKDKEIRCACGEKLSWYVTSCPACGRAR